MTSFLRKAATSKTVSIMLMAAFVALGILALKVSMLLAIPAWIVAYIFLCKACNG